MKRSNWMRWGAAAALAAGMAFAQAPAPATGSEQAAPSGQHRMMRQQRREQMQERLTRELNLTPAQQQQSKALFGRMREDAKPLREEMRRNHEAMQAAIQANNAREIHNLAGKQATLVGQLMEMRANTMAKFYTTLTPQQKTKFQQVHQRMRQRWQERNEEQPAS